MTVDDPRHAHETILELVLQHLLTSDDLAQLCAGADAPVLHTDDGPVRLTTVASYHDAGVLTLDHGVWLELTDGSRFGLTIRPGQRPDRDVTLQPGNPDTTQH